MPTISGAIELRRDECAWWPLAEPDAAAVEADAEDGALLGVTGREEDAEPDE